MSVLQPSKGATKVRKRVGRGIGSGLGKTAGRGQKGQKSRSGGGVPVWFEGGQQPLYRRIPKRGFTNNFATEWTVINIERLAGVVDKAGTTIDNEALKKAGFAAHETIRTKLIGPKKKDADVSALSGKTIIVNYATEGAKKLAESAGAKVEIVKFKPSKKKRDASGEASE